ncbi:MAG: hypothetical protein PF569_09130 [Candidatus Woesearchaeota archaeon]|jgi:hypothetical protein|nr:hypothetical protein [Candidatus Woesearchaeota archaeon]
METKKIKELIEWGCKSNLAEGFQLKENGDFYTPEAPRTFEAFLEEIVLYGYHRSLTFLVLLDRLVQGITKSDLPYLIIQNHFAIAIIDTKDHCSFVEFDYVDYSVDQARFEVCWWIKDNMEKGLHDQETHVRFFYIEYTMFFDDYYDENDSTIIEAKNKKNAIVKLKQNTSDENYKKNSC